MMKNTTLSLALAGAGLATILAAAPATVTPATAQPREQCLRANQIDSFGGIRGNERAIIVTDRFRNRYKVSFNTTCDDVDYNGALQIRSQANSGLSCIQRGDVVISRSVGGWRDRCVISRVERYTPAMERADRQWSRERDRYTR